MPAHYLPSKSPQKLHDRVRELERRGEEIVQVVQGRSSYTIITRPAGMVTR